MPEENPIANKSKENIPKSPIKMIEQLAKIKIRPKVISTFFIEGLALFRIKLKFIDSLQGCQVILCFKPLNGELLLLGDSLDSWCLGRIRNTALGGLILLQARYISLTDRMIEYGPNLGLPHTDAFGAGLFELRLKGAQGIA